MPGVRPSQPAGKRAINGKTSFFNRSWQVAGSQGRGRLRQAEEAFPAPQQWIVQILDAFLERKNSKKLGEDLE
jgi:hypothetical protein